MLSTSCKYAIRAVIYLGLPENIGLQLGIRKISDDLKIPSPYLAKILQMLTRGKVLISSKGPGGGFKLASDPESISLYDIVRVMDGTGFFDNCVIGIRNCNEEGHITPCAMHDRFHQIRCRLHSLFRETSLSDILKGTTDLNSVISL